MYPCVRLPRLGSLLVYANDCGGIFSVLINTPGELLDVVVIFSVTELTVIVSVLIIKPIVLASVKLVVVGVPV